MSKKEKALVKVEKNLPVHIVEEYDRWLPELQDYDKFAVTFSPLGFLKLIDSFELQASFIENAISIQGKLKTPSIVAAKTLMGEDNIHKYIMALILDLNEYLNIKRKLENSQIAEIAYYIMKNFYNLSVCEVFMIFSNAKLGAYGEFFESITGAKILGWFTKYSDKRAVFFADSNINKAVEHKNTTHNLDILKFWKSVEPVKKKN